VHLVASTYTFVATMDDGMRVWIDGNQIINGWKDQRLITLRSAPQTFATDADHDIKVEFYQGGGDATAQLTWTGGAGAPRPNQPPTATILTPAAGTKFKAGDPISFSGSGSDPEDGSLPASALTWAITIQHCPHGASCHTHILTTQTSPTCQNATSCGSFAAPDHEEDFHLVVQLTATDSQGLTGTSTVRLDPLTIQLKLDTSPSGLQVVYNGVSAVAPLITNPIIGGTRTILAPSPQGSYTFGSWSDTGAQQHNITIPTADTSFTATYTSNSGSPPPPPPPSSGGEQLTNPGFESGATGWVPPPSWFSNVASVNSTLAHSGAASFRFRGRSSGPYLYQDVPIAAPQSIAYSVWVNVPLRNASMNGVIELVALNVNGGQLGATSLMDFSNATNGWVQVSGSQALPAGTTTVRFRVRFGTLDGTVYVDDFSVLRIP
jgi:hypothetical protein